MKTFVVLAALVAITIAVPAHLNNGRNYLPEESSQEFTRFKKSTDLDAVSDINPTDEVIRNPNEDNIADARTFHKFHKKHQSHEVHIHKPIVHHHTNHHYPSHSHHYPIHHFRDNEENIEKEHEESLGENLNKDNEIIAKKSSPEHHLDLKSNINKAKEAVQTIKSNFDEIEMKSDRINDWKNSGSDKSFHQGLRSAKEALDLVHKSFNEFETFKDDDAMTSSTNGVPIQIAKMSENIPQSEKKAENMQSKIGELSDSTLNTQNNQETGLKDKKENKNLIVKINDKKPLNDEATQDKAMNAVPEDLNASSINEKESEDSKNLIKTDHDINPKTKQQLHLPEQNVDIKAKYDKSKLKSKETQSENIKIHENEKLNLKSAMDKLIDGNLNESKTKLQIPNGLKESEIPMMTSEARILESDNESKPLLSKSESKLQESANEPKTPSLSETKILEIPGESKKNASTSELKISGTTSVPKMLVSASEPKMSVTASMSNMLMPTSELKMSEEAKLSSTISANKLSKESLISPQNFGLYNAHTSKHIKSDEKRKSLYSHPQSRGAYTGVSSYGAGSAQGGGSALGIFPKANVGGCAVPLLISCSPSVVHGSLSKYPNSGYASPSYRTSHNSNVLNKINPNKLN